MGLAQQIGPADVILDLEASNKEAVLEALAAVASQRLGRPQEEILGALNAREKLGSTALGRGVALPHARLEGDDPPVILFARLHKPIEFEARDEVPVDLVVLVVWPDKSPEGFLPTLSETCRALRSSHALRRIRNAATPAEVATLLEREAQSEDDAAEGE